MKTIALALFILLFVSCSSERDNYYSVPNQTWSEELGNHRALLKIDRPADAVVCDIEWRRHDKNPEAKQFIIVHKESGDTVKNIFRKEVNNEKCSLAFGPVQKNGTYAFYYLPYLVQKDYGFYNLGYLKPEEGPSEEWVKNNGLNDPQKWEQLSKAELMKLEARSEFDSFYPMEVIALQKEKDSLLNIYQEEFLIFPESREHPIRMLDEIPQKWVQQGPAKQFEGAALQNEYYAFQLGVFAGQKDVENLRVEFSGLKNGEHSIPQTALTCFNTGGIDPYGKPFTKRLDLEKGNVQPLWIGVDVPKEIAPGKYSGKITVFADNAKSQTVDVVLKIKSEVLADRGDNEPWRHSRLRWLNSTLGIDDEPTKPYKAIQAEMDGSYNMSGKKFVLSPKGLPASLSVKGTEILNRPMELVVETRKGKVAFSDVENVQLLKNKPGIMSGSWENSSSEIQLSGIGTIEADGYINYRVKLKALNDIQLKDVRLEIPLKAEIARYMMGMDLPGTSVPQKHIAEWEGPHDSFWIGNTHAGLWCEFRGGAYHGPLLNLYHPEYPESWYNGNKGGFKVDTGTKEVKAVAYSGKRELKKGEELEFEWSMLITPVKDINYRSQFTDRYYHNGGNPIPSDEDLSSGVKIVNLHHANNYNPHINYPFVAVDSMKWFVDKMHEKGQKVKIYYTIRELTNYTTEIWALRSLGNEILGSGRGGGYPWLREHLVDNYRPQWYQWFPEKSADASIVNAPGDSRWYNYYIEGLRWLVQNVDIDGLYLDDVSYDRRTVKRIRKVLDREKPGCLLDLHSNTGFSKGPATQYTEYFPYIDKLWFGESFQYSKMPPENWLVEVSGIPFGLMGDMLHGGGNRWLGMLYGMTVRHPWMTEGVTCDPRPVWRIWDQFKIEDSKMIGFWESEPTVITSDQNVLATTYKKEGSALISIGNFSDKSKEVELYIDFKELGLNPEKIKMYSPEIKDFQPYEEWKTSDKITVDARKGWLIFVEKKGD